MMSLRSFLFRSVSSHRKPRRGVSRNTVRPIAQRLLVLESLETRTLLSASSVINFALSPTVPAPNGSDSGVVYNGAAFPETFHDNVTNVTKPTLTGLAPQGSTVSVYAENDGNVNGVLDTTNDVLLGTATVPGSDPNQNGTWSITSGTDLNTLSHYSTDGERTLFAYDSSDPAGTYATLVNPVTGVPGIYICTVGPQILPTNITFASNNQSVQSPTGPTTAVSALNLLFTDTDVRTTDFPGSPNFSAVNQTVAQDVSNYQLVGAHGGRITIASAVAADQTQVGGTGQSQVTLSFAGTLPDDTYTLTVSGNIVNDPGNALQGGTFTITFGVQGGQSLAVELVQGTQYTDLQSAVAGTTVMVAPFYKPSDVVFAGNFPDATPGGANTGIADGYSKPAAYGLDNGQYRFLFKSDVDGSVQSVVSPVQTPGLPVAGNFDGVASNGSEVGLFNGTTWYLFNTTVDPSSGQISLSLSNTVNWAALGGPRGLPVVGDFNGNGIADLAVWSNTSYYVSFGSNNYSQIDSVVPLGFSGANARPVAADIDSDGIADLGLWIPSNVASTPATWYFLPSGGNSLSGRTTSFTPVSYQFGNSNGVPFTGIFSPTTLPGIVTPQVGSSMASPFYAATPKLTVAAASSAKVAAAPTPKSLTVNGTAGSDTVQLSAGRLPNTWVLTVNGKSQTIASSVTTLNLNGLGGSNKLIITGTGKNETAEIWPTHAYFHSGNLMVTATNFTNTSAVGGGNDVVRFHDATGANSFVASPGTAKLSGATYSAQAVNFGKSMVISAKGASDTAALYSGTATPTISNSSTSNVVNLVGAGIGAETAFFSKVQVYNKSGAVVKTFVPTKPTVATQKLAPTTLSPATSKSLKQTLAAAALLTAQNNLKSSGAPAPALVDAVLASVGR